MKKLTTKIGTWDFILIILLATSFFLHLHYKDYSERYFAHQSNKRHPIKLFKIHDSKYNYAVEWSPIREMYYTKSYAIKRYYHFKKRWQQGQINTEKLLTKKNFLNIGRPYSSTSNIITETIFWVIIALMLFLGFAKRPGLTVVLGCSIGLLVSIIVNLYLV